MKVIIAGSRGITYEEFINGISSCPFLGKITTIISGTAQGADTFGEQWARDKQLPVERYPADWQQHGKAAGPLRNSEMAKVADGLIAIWDGKSKGTLDMISKSTHLKYLYVFTVDNTGLQF